MSISKSRIERSNNYIFQWRNYVSGLRTQRLEGFPTYQEFVERRLGATFDYLNRLKARFENLMQDITQFHDYYIHKQQAFSSEKAAKKEARIERLQESAEFLTMAFLIPYYLASTISHFAFPNSHASSGAEPQEQAASATISDGPHDSNLVTFLPYFVSVSPNNKEQIYSNPHIAYHLPRNADTLQTPPAFTPVESHKSARKPAFLSGGLVKNSLAFVDMVVSRFEISERDVWFSLFIFFLLIALFKRRITAIMAAAIAVFIGRGTLSGSQ